MKIRYGIVVLAGLFTQGCLASAENFGVAFQEGKLLPSLQYTNPAISNMSFFDGYGASLDSTELLPPPLWDSYSVEAPQLSYYSSEDSDMIPTIVSSMSAVIGSGNGSWISSGYTQCQNKKYSSSPIANEELVVKSNSQNKRRSKATNVDGSSTSEVAKEAASAPAPLLDSDLYTEKANGSYEFLLSGQGQWQVVGSAIVNAITNPPLYSVCTSSSIQNAGGSAATTAPASIPFFSAALIEYFAARLAMTSSAFVENLQDSSNAAEGSAPSGFLNMQFSSSFGTLGTTALNSISGTALASGTQSEQAIVSNFSTQAQLLFSWAFYLRNILTPASLNLSQPNVIVENEPVVISMTSGCTLGALETFAGVVVINPYYETSPLSTPLDIQQVVFSNNGGQPGAVNELIAFDKTSRAASSSVTNVSFPHDKYRIVTPGLTAFQIALDSSQSSYVNKNQGGVVTFFPVSNQQGTVNLGGRFMPSYAIQEPADNWNCAPVSNSKDMAFRQVSFQMIEKNGGPLTASSSAGGTAVSTPAWYTVGVGAITQSVQVQYPTNITFGNTFPVSSSSNLTEVVGGLSNVDQILDSGINYNDPVYQAFFSDLQPWAVVLQVVNASTSAGGNVNVVLQGLVKLNSYDFPLVFAQNPIAADYTSNAPVAVTGSQDAGGSENISFDSSSGTGSTSITTYSSAGIAFTQRDVWMGPATLYHIANYGTTASSNAVTQNYSFAYLFLQALYNGHLYSSSANSLYSCMQKNKKTPLNGKVLNNNLIGEIGSVSYDYTTEKEMTLYPLATSEAVTQFPLQAGQQTLRDVWPINEPRPEPAPIDWLGQTSPVDWVFLRALMVMRAFVENTGVTAQALAFLPQIIQSPTTTIPGSGVFPTYIPQTTLTGGATIPAYQTYYPAPVPVTPVAQSPSVSSKPVSKVVTPVVQSSGIATQQPVI